MVVMTSDGPSPRSPSLRLGLPAFLVRIDGLEKSPKIPGNTFSDALLKSRLQNFVADAARKKPRFARFFMVGVTKKNDAHLQSFLPGTLHMSSLRPSLIPSLQLCCLCCPPPCLLNSVLPPQCASSFPLFSPPFAQPCLPLSAAATERAVVSSQVKTTLVWLLASLLMMPSPPLA